MLTKKKQEMVDVFWDTVSTSDILVDNHYSYSHYVIISSGINRFYCYLVLVLFILVIVSFT